MSAKNIITVTITGFLLSACNQVVDEYSLKKNTKQIEKPEPSPTKADWDGALKKLIPEEKVSQEGNGTYSFASYPLPKNNLKGTALLGSRDEFRKIRHYRTYLGYSDYPRGADVNFYIALVDYGQPEFFVKPVYKGDSWLFFDRVQFLADGVVVIDKKFKQDELSRDYGSGWVYESADFIAGGDDIAALRVFAKSKNTAIRLSGDKRYASVSKKSIDSIKEYGISETLVFYDLMAEGLKGKIPKEKPAT